jgi:hypothetical protein
MLKQKLGERLNRVPPYGIWDSYEHVVHYTDKTLAAMLEAGGFEPQVITFGKPIHVPVWHEYVGHFYQYPMPFVLDPKRQLVRNVAYQIGRVEARLTGHVGYFPPNLVALASPKATR